MTRSVNWAFMRPLLATASGRAASRGGADLGEGKHVSAKVPEFVAIALLAFRGVEKAGVVAHIRRAIRLGATREELFEILETYIVPGGAPTFQRGLSALIELDAEETK